MSKRGQWAEMADVIPDQALFEVGVAAQVGDLGEAIKSRYGDRVQRIGLYSIGSVIDIDPDAASQVVADLKS